MVSGSISETLPVPLEKVWAIAGDFANFQKWAPGFLISTEILDGEGSTVGTVRKITFKDQGESTATLTEKLIAYDAEKHYYEYQFMENPWGYANTSGSLKFDDAGEASTLATWSFHLDPVADEVLQSVPADVAVTEAGAPARLKFLLVQLGESAASA